MGQPVTWLGGPAHQYSGRPLALKRAVGNLIDNAVRYGERARVRTTAQGILVEDDGPGIPEDLLEHVF